MGFRSSFVTEHWHVAWPEWFREKYKATVRFPAEHGLISSLAECKFYGAWSELAEDIQKAIDWDDLTAAFIFVALHECGGVTRCEITKDAISWTEPTGWRASRQVEHHYCYGCSDADRAARALDQN